MVEQGTEGNLDPAIMDPRVLLADWANKSDDWVRHIVRLVLGSGRSLSDADVDLVYEQFRQEKLLDERTLPPEPLLAVEVEAADREAPLELVSISEVHGVNALKSGSTISFNSGLTILFGENGTGKTGYARILKALANSRTVDDVLPDIHSREVQAPEAAIAYKLGAEEYLHNWQGGRGQAPFTRVSVFDSPAVNFHVDEDLAYVYTPASLALFNHVTQGIQGVQNRLETDARQLAKPSTNLLGRFERGSTVYPMIEGLGAATDVAALEHLAMVGPNGEKEVHDLELAIAALQVGALPQQIATHQRTERVINECLAVVTRFNEFDVDAYNETLVRLAGSNEDYARFRSELFSAAELPTTPEDTWVDFVRAGQAYRAHLEGEGVHDEGRCLYCRQALGADAIALLAKYSKYLEDRIAGDIARDEDWLAGAARPLQQVSLTETDAFLQEHEPTEGKSAYARLFRRTFTIATAVRQELNARVAINIETLVALEGIRKALTEESTTAKARLGELRDQLGNRDEALRNKTNELRELKARVELRKSWSEIIAQIRRAQEASKLATFGKKVPPILRQLTELSKNASDQLINQNFGQLFEEECRALRTPELHLEFVGRQGRAQRRKVLTGNHKPSKILSEGEQKVLALADFLAEARLTGITAPIVFDDPVCSLDHRRIQEVAERVTLLAQTSQVVVFTHDILFATSLLSRFEKSKRCAYFQVTDEDGKGNIAHATGPRWDTLGNLKKKVNETIQAAKTQEGEARAALVRTGYDWVRSWCEVFVEQELLAQVTERYQPNVRMTALDKIKPFALPDAIATVSRVFEDACRYIDGHSQPLPALSISPTLHGLEADWATLQDCRKKYQEA